MNFYEYHEHGEQLDESHVYLAARDLMKSGFNVIPLKPDTKEPDRVRSVYDFISKPINDHNFDFYFKDRDVDLAIIMDHNMEFIDIDPKNKPGIGESVLRAIESGWPELYEKLVIDKTPTGGYHLIYRSEVIGGHVVLAKVKHSPNPLAIIERISRSNKQYIKISPSKNYELIQLNPFEIPFLSAEERNFISAVCASFNELEKPEVKKKEAEREDSPWFVYNATHDWQYIKSELLDRNWQLYREDINKVYVRRPGDTKQKYSGVIFKDSNSLYLFTSSSEFQNERPYSPFGVYCLFYHDNDIASACKQLASEGCGVNIFNEGQFWKKDKKRLDIKYTELLVWLHSIGYRKYNNSVVQVIDNVVKISNDGDMVRAFLNEVEFEIKDEMFEKIPTIFKESGGLMAMLQELPDNFICDDETKTWLFFKNFAIKITADKIEPIQYKELNGYIWESSIIDREFFQSDYVECDADRFISILGGDRKERLMQLIGYGISRYKDPTNPRALIFMEDTDSESEGESQGGSGKGLCCQFIKQYRKTTEFDGKSFKPGDPFLYQNIDHDTAIILIDDVDRKFKFSALFSILSNSLAINKKGKQQIIVPYEKSPKIIITSNYSIGDMDMSSRRRKYEFPVVKHFGEDVTPMDLFKRRFFMDWDTKEWLRFDNLMAVCCQKYLSESDKREMTVTTVNTAERSLINNTHRDFIEYMDRQLASNFFDFCPAHFKTLTVHNPDNSVSTNAVNMAAWLHVADDPDNFFTASKHEFLEKIIRLTGVKYLTTTRLTQWVKRWAESREVEVNVSYQRTAIGEKKYRFIHWNNADFDKTKSGNSGNSEVVITTSWTPVDKDGF